MSEPPLGQNVRDRSGRVWRSWVDAEGVRWWVPAGISAGERLGWSMLERKYGPLVIF